MSNDWWDAPPWSRSPERVERVSPFRGKPQPYCGVCGEQIASVSDIVPYGKKGAVKHSGCKPMTTTPVKTALPQNVKRSCKKGRRGWRKRHCGLVLN